MFYIGQFWEATWTQQGGTKNIKDAFQAFSEQGQPANSTGN